MRGQDLRIIQLNDYKHSLSKLINHVKLLAVRKALAIFYMFWEKIIRLNMFSLYFRDVISIRMETKYHAAMCFSAVFVFCCCIF